jgi:hypothetical protein
MEDQARQQSDETPFPKPQWPPIQNLDSIDLAGVRRDGGVDLIIVASQPLDDDPQTLDSIRRKVDTYLAALDVPEFQEQMGHPPPGQIAIFIACDYPIHPAALAVIEECKRTAALRVVRLDIRKRDN